MLKNITAVLIAILLAGCAGQYQNLNSKLYACGYPKAKYVDFHDCMQGKVVVSKDPVDYYSKTANEFLAEMSYYRDLIDKKKISNKKAMDGIGKFIDQQVLKEQKANQEAGAITAVFLLGVGAAACANNGCFDGGGGGNSYQGCCSWHGGITNMCAPNGHILCVDGTPSPSCRC